MECCVVVPDTSMTILSACGHVIYHNQVLQYTTKVEADIIEVYVVPVPGRLRSLPHLV